MNCVDSDKERVQIVKQFADHGDIVGKLRRRKGIRLACEDYKGKARRLAIFVGIVEEARLVAQE